MVIKDDNALFLSDLMCFSPHASVDLIEKTIEKSTGKFDQRFHDEIIETVSSCSCAKTPDGIKACLVLSRENMSKKFRQPGISSDFNNFMEELDKLVGEARNTIAYNVNWYL